MLASSEKHRPHLSLPSRKTCTHGYELGLRIYGNSSVWGSRPTIPLLFGTLLSSYPNDMGQQKAVVERFESHENGPIESMPRSSRRSLIIHPVLLSRGDEAVVQAESASTIKATQISQDYHTDDESLEEEEEGGEGPARAPRTQNVKVTIPLRQHNHLAVLSQRITRVNMMTRILTQRHSRANQQLNSILPVGLALSSPPWI